MEETEQHEYFFWSRPTDKAVTVATALLVVPSAAKTATVATLRCLGFSSKGPVAGSWAASWMSKIALSGKCHGVGAAMFSWAQHVAMTVPLVTPSAAILGTLAGGYYAYRYVSINYPRILESGVWGGSERVDHLRHMLHWQSHEAAAAGQVEEVEEERVPLVVEESEEVGEHSEISVGDLISLEEGVVAEAEERG